MAKTKRKPSAASVIMLPAAVGRQLLEAMEKIQTTVECIEKLRHTLEVVVDRELERQRMAEVDAAERRARAARKAHETRRARAGQGDGPAPAGPGQGGADGRAAAGELTAAEFARQIRDDEPIEGGGPAAGNNGEDGPALVADPQMGFFADDDGSAG
jgi:hypothetical protein